MWGGAVHGGAWHAAAQRGVARCVVVHGVRPLDMAQHGVWRCVVCGSSTWHGAVHGVQPPDMARRGAAGSFRPLNVSCCEACGHLTCRVALWHGAAQRAVCSCGQRAWGCEKREKKGGREGG